MDDGPERYRAARPKDPLDPLLVAFEAVDDDRPETEGLSGGLAYGAAWLGIAAAVVAFPGVALAVMAVIGSYTWPGPQYHAAGSYYWISDPSGGAIVWGAAGALAVSMVLFAVARSLMLRPRGAVRVLTFWGALLAVPALVLLLAPGVIMGPVTYGRPATGLTDAQFAAVALLLPAALCLVAASLARAALRRQERTQSA